MKTILAIESAIRGGSVSIVRDGKIVGFAVGTGGASRAEDLLPVIQKLVGETLESKHSFDTVAVSVGPGSFTGLRIGIATALGLKNSLNLDCIGVSLLEALAGNAGFGRIASIVPIGKSDICYQIFDRSNAGMSSLIGPAAVDSSKLAESLAGNEIDEVILHDDLLNGPLGDFSGKQTPSGPNLSGLIGVAAHNGIALHSLEPIYVQSPRFS